MAKLEQNSTYGFIAGQEQSLCKDNQDNMGKYGFAIDRGGTFTDVYIRRPDGSSRVMKLLSEDPQNYRDAPTEAIRRVLESVSPKFCSGFCIEPHLHSFRNWESRCLEDSRLMRAKSNGYVWAQRLRPMHCWNAKDSDRRWQLRKDFEICSTSAISQDRGCLIWYVCLGLARGTVGRWLNPQGCQGSNPK